MVAALALWHQTVTADYVALLDQVGRRTDANPLQRPLPGNFADAQAWVRHAVDAEQAGTWQVRHTTADNAPQGRDVHWSSYFVHLIRLAARVQQARTGSSFHHAAEQSLAWFNFPLFLGCVVCATIGAARRWGAGAAVVLGAGMVGHLAFYDGFLPNYVDHHGPLTACALGLSLGALFMGGGWIATANANTTLVARFLPATAGSARRAAIVSALCGAVGMWLSAASTIPVVAVVGCAGLVASLACGRSAQKSGAVFDPTVWRTWGRVGCLAALFFYALEYAPRHLGFRLEVNHPFHALAWWGGGELIALVSARHLRVSTASPPVWQWLLPALALTLSPVTILIGGTAVFAVSDPFVGELRHMVMEGVSFRAATRLLGQEYALRYLINFLIVGAGLVAIAISRPHRLILTFATVLALGFLAMACLEVRWWLTASGPILCLLLLLVGVAADRQSALVRWSIVLVAAAVLIPNGAIRSARGLGSNIAQKAAAPADLLQPLYRDIAAALRVNQPKGDIILLASPDASNGIGYYGLFKTIGTLYWENVPGLKAAAEIYCAETDDAALELMRRRGITHLAYVSMGNFIEEYFRLLQPARPVEEITRTFAHRVFVQKRLPHWVRVLPYRTPDNMKMADLDVLLLQVVPNQTPAEGAWHLARSLLQLNNAPAAEMHFRSAISSLPPAERGPEFRIAAELLYRQGALPQAIALYREAVSSGGEPRAIAELAWVLATANDATVRNGGAALQLLEPLSPARSQDPALLNVFAATLAEVGRFADAAEAASRALAIVQAAGDVGAVATIQQRLDAYRAGRPWRQ